MARTPPTPTGRPSSSAGSRSKTRDRRPGGRRDHHEPSTNGRLNAMSTTTTKPKPAPLAPDPTHAAEAEALEFLAARNGPAALAALDGQIADKERHFHIQADSAVDPRQIPG